MKTYILRDSHAVEPQIQTAAPLLPLFYSNHNFRYHLLLAGDGLPVAGSKFIFR